MHGRVRFGPLFVSVFAFVLSGAGAAWSAGINQLPAVQLHITSDQGIDTVLDAAAMGCSGGSGYTGYSVSCNGYDYDLGKAELAALNLNFVVDPEVHLNISLINTSTTDQTFTLQASLPTAPLAGPNSMGGSVAGSLTETNGGGSGATVSALPNGAIYTALIDSASVAQLHGAPFSVSVTNNFESTTIPSAAFGQPIPSAAAPAVLSDIGVKLNFRLSPGDQVALTSVFVVQATTPEPAVGGLLGAAALALLGLRRRSL
jgi:hypothetical protein